MIVDSLDYSDLPWEWFLVKFEINGSRKTFPMSLFYNILLFLPIHLKINICCFSENRFQVYLFVRRISHFLEVDGRGEVNSLRWVTN